MTFSCSRGYAFSDGADCAGIRSALRFLRSDPLDDRQRGRDQQLLRGRVEIGETAAIGKDPEIAVEAKDAREEVGAETVHHRHDDDQGGNAERSAYP